MGSMNSLHIALIWLPFSILLHLALHELSHAAVAKLYGATDFHFRLWPDWTGRPWWSPVWARVEFQGQFNPQQTGLISAAPIILAIAWHTGASFWAYHWIARVEGVLAGIDCIVWLSGWWMPTPNPNCDAERFRIVRGYVLWHLRVFSVFLFVAIVAVVVKMVIST
jgi:hypothetical protein